MIPLADTFLYTEYQHELANTQRMLERIADSHLEWRPHPKSRTLLSLANHIIKVIQWPAIIMKSEAYDISKEQTKESSHSATEIVNAFHQNAHSSLEAVHRPDQAVLTDSWMLRHGDRVILEMPRYSAIRRLGFNHLYHHRAQLGMYLRLLDFPVPGMYGPSADEMEHFKE